MWNEFKSFLLKTNALALAIGVIIGAALGSVVNSLVNDVIMPPIGKILGNVDFSSLVIDLGDDVAIRYGTFINSVIAFIVIGFVVWRISKAFIKEEAPPSAAPKTCPFCRQPNAIDATKCMHCASAI